MPRKSGARGPIPSLLRSLTVAVSLALPGGAIALSLGDIKLETSLNEPLRAQIRLGSVTAEELEDMQVHLGSTEVFKRLGMARPGVLTRLKFEPTKLASGETVVLVTSDLPIQEPFLNFLVEVQWPRGRLLREYTLLLDPPVVADKRAPVAVQAPKPAPPPLAAQPKPKPSPATVAKPAIPLAQEPASEPEPESISEEPPASSPVAGSADTEYKVRRNDTLSEIAHDMRSLEGSQDQRMLALFRANPNAFYRGNINNLRAGVILRAPSAEDVRAVQRDEASRLVAEQNAAWKQPSSVAARESSAETKDAQAASGDADKTDVPGPAPAREDARLEILAANEAGTGQSADAQRALKQAREQAASSQKEKEDLASRVKELEGLLSKQQRIIELQQQELTDLQRSLSSEKSDKPAPAAAQPETKVTPEPTPAPTPSTQTDPVPGGEAPGSEVAPVAAPTPEPLQADRDSLFDNKGFVVAAGAVALVMIAMAALALRRNRTSHGETEEERFALASGEAGEAFDESPARVRDTAVSPSEAMDESPAFSESEMRPETEAEPQQDGVLADADVYLAYGLHGQAEQLLMEALEKDPERDDYRMKLLESYYSAKNRSGFDRLAQQMHQRVGGTGETWARIRDMGQDLSPENPLFYPVVASDFVSQSAFAPAHAAAIESQHEQGPQDARWAQFLGQPPEDEGKNIAASADVHEFPADLLGETRDATELPVDTGRPAVAASVRKEAGFSPDDAALDAELEKALSELDSDPFSDGMQKTSGGGNGQHRDRAARAFADDVAAKLDLAKAYLDMGDNEGARGLLQEVLTEGSEGQCQEARRLEQQIG